MKREDRIKLYHELVNQISANPVNKESQDALFFMAGVRAEDNPDAVDVVCVIPGKPGNIEDLLTSVVRKAAIPKGIKKAIAMTTLDILREAVEEHGNTKAGIIGALLFQYIEEFMGGINCDCEECRKKRAEENKKDINVN